MVKDTAKAKKKMQTDAVLFVKDPTTGLVGIFLRSKLDAGKVSCPCGRGKLKKSDVTGGYSCQVCKRVLDIKPA